MKYNFNGTLYFKHMWYIYALWCFGITGFLWILMIANGTFDIAPAIVSFLSVIFIAFLLLINRIRTWTGSYVEVTENLVKYVRIVQNGYLDKNMNHWVKKVSSHYIATVLTVEYGARKNKIYGCIDEEISYQDEYVSDRKMKRKDVVLIPKFFENEHQMNRDIIEFYKRRAWQNGRSNQR